MLAGAEGPPQAMPLDQALEQLKTYDYGQPDAALHVIEMEVTRAAPDPAAKAKLSEALAAILAQPGTSKAAKVFICQQLLVVGTEAQVPLLAKMLDNPQTAEIARFTLQAIPGEASLAAIRGSLERLTGGPLVGAVNSVGIRRDAQSVPALEKLLGTADPQVAAACAESLGKIATTEAAAALTKAQVPDKAMAALHNAQLQCAERLATAGDTATAAALYQHVWSSSRPAAWRMAGLAGLAKVAKDQAAPLVLESLSAEDPLLRATAVQLTRELPGPEVTAALVERLDALDPAGQVLLLAVLAERGDRSAADAVSKRMDSQDEAVRAAAIQAMARLGDASVVTRLAQLAATAGGATQQAARASLARLSGADVEAKLLALAAEGEVEVRIEILRALAARYNTGAAPVMLRAATDADPRVRMAAMDALAVVAGADSYAKLVDLLVAAPTAADGEAAERALLATGTRLADPAEALRTALAALEKAPAQAKPSLLRVLGGLAGPAALEAVRARASDPDPAVRDAAVRVLAAWVDVSAAADLLKIAQASDVAAHRALAIRGYLRLAGAVPDAAERLKLLEQIRPIATTKASKLMLLAALSEAADAGALHVAAEFLDDAEVQAEAAAATLKVARALVRTEPAAVRGAMKKLMDATKDKATGDEAAALDDEAQKVPSPAAAQLALQYDQKRSDAQKAALVKRAPQGFHLACYLDCGPDTADGAKGGPLLRLVAGTAYFWPESVRLADVRFGSVAFDAERVVFEAAGLNPKKSYQIGFTWWDFDHGTRVQSVLLATGKGDREAQALQKTALPSGAGNQGPDGKTFPVPAELYGDGSLRISIRNEGQPNAVVSEVWLWESDAEGAAGR